MGSTTTLNLSTLLILASATALTPWTAQAQQPADAAAEPSSADRATARALAQEGFAALRSKDYRTAIDRYSRALVLVHAPSLLLDLARSQMGAGRLVDAQESYNRIIREGVAPQAPAPWVKALDAAKAEVGAIAPRLPWITITVTGPSEPVVTIDGTPIAVASLGVRRPADPGEHEIRASGTGYYAAKKRIQLEEGETLAVSLELEAAPPEAEPEAASPSAVTAAPASPAWRQPVMLGAFVVGGAGLVLGSVAGVLAIDKHEKLNGQCLSGVCGPKQQKELDTYHLYGTLSTVGFIAAGVGGAVGGLLLFINPKQEEADTIAVARATWSPYVGVGSAGVEGTF